MFGSDILDVAIGMIFIYLLLSLICSAVNEIIEAWQKKRATDLERGIRELLNDPKGDGLVKQLYEHHLVSGLFRGEYEPEKIHARSNRYQVRGLLSNKDAADLPSYIPARNFALALMDVFLPAAENASSGAAGATARATKTDARGGSPPQPEANPLQPLRDAINASTVATPAVKGALLSLLDAAGNDANKARENIEKWFDSSMDRVSGWYKRRSQVIILFLGFGLTVFANADSIAISKSLANDPSVRQSLVVASQEYAKANPAPTPGATTPAPAPSPEKDSPFEACQKDANSPECRVAQNLHQLEEFGLPIGWDLTNRNAVPTPPWLVPKGDDVAWWTSVGNWLLKLLGWLVTAAAISLGAPFWFDLLNKFMIVRSTVKPHEKSPEEKSIG